LKNLCGVPTKHKFTYNTPIAPRNSLNKFLSYSNLDTIKRKPLLSHSQLHCIKTLSANLTIAVVYKSLSVVKQVTLLAIDNLCHCHPTASKSEGLSAHCNALTINFIMEADPSPLESNYSPHKYTLNT
jgi:hypothetical protein